LMTCICRRGTMLTTGAEATEKSEVFWLEWGAKWLNDHEISMKISAMKGRTALDGLLFSLPLHLVQIESVFALLHF